MDILSTFIKDILLGILHSCKGFLSVFYIDRENRKKALRRSPSHAKTPRRSRKTPDKKEEKQESSLFSRIRNICISNILVVIGIYMFETVIIWLVYYFCLIVYVLWYGGEFEPQSVLRIYHNINTPYQVIMAIPIIMLVKIFNNFWFGDVARAAFKYNQTFSRSNTDLSRVVADYIFSGVVEGLFLLQALIVGWIPIQYLNDWLHISMMSLLTSLYAFEYKWSELGYNAKQRLELIERKWPYFLGFGFPLVLLTHFLPLWSIKTTAFSIIFPFLIISACEANIAPDFSVQIPVFYLVVRASNSLFGLFKQPKATPKPSRQR